VLFFKGKIQMTSVVNETIIIVAATATLSIVLIGGIYYILPTWNALPDQSTVEDKFAQYGTAPVNIAGGIGSKLGENIMKAAGWTYTATELQKLRPQLFSRANVPNTPENAAQQLYEIMMKPGQLVQLQKARVNLLGTTNSEWNQSVSTVFYPMYSKRLEDSMLVYISKEQ
jgi:hypothetical protein